MRAAVDSDWSVRRSTSGGCLLLAGTTPHAVSRRQDCSAESSTAAELVAASTFVGDIAYGVSVLNFVGLTQGTVEMDLDNQAAGDIAQDYSASNRTKHLARRDFRVREAVFSSQLSITTRLRSRIMWPICTQRCSRSRPSTGLRGWALGSIVSAGTSVVALLVSAARLAS